MCGCVCVQVTHPNGGQDEWRVNVEGVGNLMRTKEGRRGGDRGEERKKGEDEDLGGGERGEGEEGD